MIPAHSSHFAARRHLILLLAFGARAGAAPDSGSAPWIIDRAVATVDGKAITLRQVGFEGRVLLVLGGAPRAAFAPLDAPALSASLATMIDERLADAEAEEVDAYPVSEDEVSKAIESFRDALGSQGELDRFLASTGEVISDLREVLRRHLRAQRQLEGRIRLKAQPTNAELIAYQKDHPEFAGEPLEQARQRLFAERFQVLARAQLEAARRAADVRILGTHLLDATRP